MDLKKINSTRVAPAIGVYSHASIVDKKIYLSGQLGLNIKGELVEGIENQTRQSLENIKNVLEDCHSNLDNVIKTTIFLQNIDDFTVVNQIYEEYFANIRPARSCIEVSKLPKNSLVEIEVIAQEK